MSVIENPSAPVVISIEDLPVEVLIEIFQFFSADTLLNAFYNLNTALNTIIEQYTPLHFNFAWTFQCSAYFNRFLLKCNPMQVKSLQLHVETNSTVLQFCQNLPFFISLRFLIFDGITSTSYNSVRDLLAVSLPHLKQLYFLKIGTRFISGTQCFELQQAALSAPSSVQYLEHFTPSLSPFPQLPALRYKGPQLNLKSFHFQRIPLGFTSLVGLFSAIPNIFSLTVILSAWDHDNVNYDDLAELRALKTLNASFTWWENFSTVRMDELRVLLTKMPNLTRLRVGTGSQNLTEVSGGEEWAKLLLTHGKKLSKVKLKFRHSDRCSAEKVESVKTTFKEHDYWRERRVAFQYGMCEEESEDEELIVKGSF